MPPTSWFGIGFGSVMINTDMITWTTKNGEASVEDQYSYNESPPTRDTKQNIRSSTPRRTKDGKVQILTRRALDTSDV